MRASKTKKRRRSRQTKSASHLPLWLALGGTLLIMISALIVWGRQPAVTVGETGAREGEGGTPQLVADREMVDFGDVPLGKTVTASFTLTNTGTGTVRFKEAPYIEVAAGC